MSGNVFVSPFNPVQQMGVRAHNPPDLITATRDPVASDWDYFLGTLWLHQGNSLWTIVSKTVSLTVKTGTWIKLSAAAGGPVTSLSVQGGAPIGPLGGNFDFSGSAAGALTFSSTGAGMIKESVNVDATSIQIIGNMLTAPGVAASVQKVGVQAASGAGTNPVVALANQINVNGSVVNAHSIPVQTDSLAANTFNVELQRTSASVGALAANAGLASFNNSQFTVDAPTGWVSLLGGAVSESFEVDASSGAGTNPVLPTVGGVVTVHGTAVNATTIPVQTNSIAANSYEIEVQRAAATVATSTIDQGLASFNSAQFSVDINGFVSSLNGLPAAKFGVQASTGPGTNPVLPTAGGLVTINGTLVGAHAIPIRTDSLAANTINVELQVASAQVTGTPTAAGLAYFDPAVFSVAIDGFVSGVGGSPVTKFAVNASSGTGTNPVVPDGTGTISLFGAAIPALGIPIRTDSTFANTYTIEGQVASAQAASAIANAGLCSFNNAQFSVDVNGFVSSLSGTPPWIDSAGGALVNHTGYFATAAAVYTLPAGVANGDEIDIADFVGGGVVLTSQGGDKIRIGNVTSIANGTATTTQLGDSGRFVYRLVGQVWVSVGGPEGNWLVV